jgi:hypothetical protein
LNTNEPLTFREAAIALGQEDDTGRSLRAMVLAREKQTGERIATRLGGEKRPKMQVTLSAIYTHLPELKPQRTHEDMSKSVRAYITAIEDRIADVAAEKIQELVMPHFKADRKRLTDLEDATDKLAEEDTKTLGLVEELSRLVAALTGAKKAS